MRKEMLVYTPKTTPRMAYVFNLVLRDWLGVDFTLTSCHYMLEDSLESKLCYGPKPVTNAFWVKPQGLLSEKDIHGIEPESVGVGEDLLLFPSDDNKSFPFDVFAAVFFMVSRYEEYLPFEPDEHGRFPSELAWGVKNRMEKIPIVDIWIKKFADALNEKFPFLALQKNSIGSTIHIDIDNAFAHRGKGLVRTGGKLALALAKFRMGEFVEIGGSNLGLLTDPFDTYDEILQQVNSNDINLRWYIHLGNLGKFDRPVSWRSSVLRHLATHLYSKGKLGIHPSYGALEDPNLFCKEVKRFKQLTGERPTFSRFHFLRFRFPYSFRMLIDEGVEFDYSMGFSDRIGYRAGTTRPFPFFDLTMNAEENLTIYPFMVMDSALNFQLTLKPDTAIEQVANLMASQQKTGGDFSVVFHNEILSHKFPWEGWSVVFNAAVNLMKGGARDS